MKSTYRDFVLEQQFYKKDCSIADFWVNELSGYKRFSFHGVKELDLNGLKAGFIYEWPSSLTSMVDLYAAEQRTSLKTVLFSAFMYALYMFTYENEFTVGLVTNNRPQKEDGEKILGCFLNTIPLRMQFDKDFTIHAFVEYVEKKLTELKRYDRLSLFEIVNIIDDDSKNANPVFDIIINYIDFHVYKDMKIDTRIKKRLQERNLSVFTRSGHTKSNTLFDVNFEPRAEGVVLSTSYNTEFVSESEIRKLIVYIDSFLSLLTTQPETILTKNVFLTNEERHKLLYVFNDTRSDYPRNKSIHELFEDEVLRNPHRIAASRGDVQVTYQVLSDRSTHLSQRLSEEGIEHGSVVGLMCGRSIEMLIGTLSILKHGCIYLPIDVDYPEVRKRFMVRDSNMALVLTDNEVVHDQKDLGKVLGISEGSQGVALRSMPSNKGYSAAYIMYTSGSTGTPKGVLVEHKGVVRLVKRVSYAELSEETITLQTGAVVFDATTFEVWGALLNGGRLIIVDKEEIASAIPLGRALDREQVNTLWLSSALFNQLVQEDYSIFKNLNGCCWGRYPQGMFNRSNRGILG